MRVLKLLPIFLVAGAVGTGAKYTRTQGESDPSILAPAQETQEAKIKDITTAFTLTQEEIKALNEMEAFLKTYTGDGNYSYGSINRFIEGLKRDYKTVREEAKNRKGDEKAALEAYPNNTLIKKLLIQQGITKNGKARITSFLEEMGVDPKTGEKPDSCEIEKYVTKPVLEQFGKNVRTIKEAIEKRLGPNKRAAFKDGINLKVVQFMKDCKAGLPPSVEIVDAPQLVENKN